MTCFNIMVIDFLTKFQLCQFSQPYILYTYSGNLCHPSLALASTILQHKDQAHSFVVAAVEFGIVVEIGEDCCYSLCWTQHSVYPHQGGLGGRSPNFDVNGPHRRSQSVSLLHLLKILVVSFVVCKHT